MAGEETLAKQGVGMAQKCTDILKKSGIKPKAMNQTGQSYDVCFSRRFAFLSSLR